MLLLLWCVVCVVDDDLLCGVVCVDECLCCDVCVVDDDFEC